MYKIHVIHGLKSILAWSEQYLKNIWLYILSLEVFLYTPVEY